MNTENNSLAGEILQPKPEEPVSESILESKPDKDLPEQVKANIELEKKSFQAENSAKQVLPTTPIKKKFDLNKILGKETSNRIFRISAIILGSVLGIFILVVLFTFSGLDTTIFKITLSGKITDITNSAPIENAQILIGDNVVGTSKADGSYAVSGLEPGKINITVKADGFDELKEEIVITKGWMDYNTRKDFALTSSGFATLNGKFVSNIGNHNFRDDKLIINDKEYNINTDGSFTAQKVKTGDAKFKFESASFKDINQIINIASGTNTIEDIVLKPAGDIIGDLKSWVREDLVLSTKFAIENVTTNQINIKVDGNYSIIDLDEGKTYKIRVTANGYLTRDYEIQIKQGVNQLFEFKLVEEGTAVFINFGNSNSNPNFFRSDFDGKNLVQLTTLSNFKPILQYYDSSEKKLYFTSTKDNVRGYFSGSANIVYSINLAAKTMTTVTTNKDNLGLITANFIAKKMVSQIKEFISGSTINKIEYMDLTGDGRVEIKKNPEEFSSIDISDNGKFVTYLQKGADAGLYRYSVENAESKLISQAKNISVFDISEDGSKVIFGRLNEATTLRDLVVYDVNTNEARVIKENFDGRSYQFIKGDSNKIIYAATRDSKDNIYIFTINQNKDDKITNLSGDIQVKFVYQESGFSFYVTNKGLYILDPNKPQSHKLVNEKAIDYAGH